MLNAHQLKKSIFFIAKAVFRSNIIYRRYLTSKPGTVITKLNPTQSVLEPFSIRLWLSINPDQSMAVTYTPVERLEFALKWESARLSYFTALGWKVKVKEQTHKIDSIQYQLNQLYSES